LERTGQIGYVLTLEITCGQFLGMVSHGGFQAGEGEIAPLAPFERFG
jgi:hypothetical protein